MGETVTIQKNWQELIRPNKLQIQPGSDPARFATIVAEPLERGFGQTLGNALRRILLSSLQGAAVQSVHIDGVLHEFSSIAGVREDVTDIVLNIKDISIKMQGEGPKRMVVKKQGPGVVTAGDIQTVGDVTVLNPDLQICTLDEGAEIIDGALMAFPLLGDIRLKYQVASLSRMLSTLLQGGIPLVPAMETAGASMTSRKVLNGVSAAASRVREGQGLAKSLEEQRIFPDLAVEMMEVGESTGALPAMLNSVAEFYEEDVQTALGAAMALIEPILLIFMAIFVGGVLISLYLPIFTLGAGVQ